MATVWFRTEDPDDPRHRVTETGFRVEPELLGRPLAHPLRRLGAILIDLSVIGTIAVSRFISPWLVALVGAWLLWRIADPAADVRLSSDHLRKLFRWTAVATATLAIIVLVAGMFTDDGPSPPPDGTRSAALSPAEAVRGSTAVDSAVSDSASVDSVVRAARRVPVAVQRLRDAPSDEAARDRASGLALEIYRAGEPRDVVADSVDDLVEEARDREEVVAWSTGREAIVDTALARLDSTTARRAAARDSLLAALAAAADSGPPERVSSLAGRVLGMPPPAGRRQLEERLSHLEEELEAARQPPSVIDLARGTLDDLGLGLGWLGIYFTASLALWRGRTPGKRLLGIRVVRIDGDPLTTWDAFSRFGGYAASVITGLLGFAQLLWDPNRQALHDRIAGTVVIRE